MKKMLYVYDKKKGEIIKFYSKFYEWFVIELQFVVEDKKRDPFSQ